MESRNQDHLSQMSTSWTTFIQLHDDNLPTEERRQARQRFFERYQTVVRRFLAGVLKSWPYRDEAVEECFARFALRFVSGAFQSADPERGRLRDYLKRALRNLVVDYQREKSAGGLPLGDIEPVAETATGQDDDMFVNIWREELISRALDALAAEEGKDGKRLYTVLRFRMDNPKMRSPEMAEALAARVGKKITPGWVRKRLLLARQRLVELLLAELTETLDRPTREEIEQELIDLKLLEYCGDQIRNSL